MGTCDFQKLWMFLGKKQYACVCVCMDICAWIILHLSGCGKRGIDLLKLHKKNILTLVMKA